MTTESEQLLATRVAGLMSRLIEGLIRTAHVPPLALPAFPPDPGPDADDLVVDLLAGVGLSRMRTIQLRATFPIVERGVAAEAESREYVARKERAR